MIRVLLADDHAVVRQGLRTFLDLQDDIEVVADVGDGEAALEAAREHEPDVVLMDLVMPGIGGVEAIRRLREVRPEARVLVLTSFLDDEKLFPAVRAGAAGYLLKDVEPAELVRAIRARLSRRRFNAPTPSSLGITRSSRMTSGSVRCAASSAASPSPASATTSMSSWRSRNVRRPWRTTA